MNSELEKQLTIDFPFIQGKLTSKARKAENNHIKDIRSSIGIQTGDGWYRLLHEMFTEITELYKIENKQIDIEIVQIKEKFGKLRFYYHHLQTPNTIHSLDFLCNKASLRFLPKDTELHKKVSEIIVRYEEKSRYICEQCGASGILRTDLPWIKTLCDEHYHETENKNNVHNRE